MSPLDELLLPQPLQVHPQQAGTFLKVVETTLPVQIDLHDLSLIAGIRKQSARLELIRNFD